MWGRHTCRQSPDFDGYDAQKNNYGIKPYGCMCKSQNQSEQLVLKFGIWAQVPNFQIQTFELDWLSNNVRTSVQLGWDSRLDDKTQHLERTISNATILMQKSAASEKWLPNKIRKEDKKRMISDVGCGFFRCYKRKMRPYKPFPDPYLRSKGISFFSRNHYCFSKMEAIIMSAA